MKVTDANLLVAILLLLSLSLTQNCLCHGSADPMVSQLTEPRVVGEGPLWDPENQVLYYVDILGKAFYRLDPATGVEHNTTFDTTLGFALQVDGHKDKFLLGLGLELTLMKWDWTTGQRNLQTLARVDQSRPGNRFNDGKADCKGRVWAGTFGPQDAEGSVEPCQGSLYRLDTPERGIVRTTQMVHPVSISNGLTWSLDNKQFYFIDSHTRRVYGFDFDATNGTLANKRVAFEFGSEVEGDPDGMTVDIDDNLWIACENGYQVIQVNPRTGQLLRQVKLPVSKVSSLAFGGPNLDTLYVTSIRAYLSSQQLEDQPLAGSVFQITNLGTKGRPAYKAVLN